MFIHATYIYKEMHMLHTYTYMTIHIYIHIYIIFGEGKTVVESLEVRIQSAVTRTT